ncbi:MAG: hypothetical protein JWP00_1494 [Chloroflexi bacterium]|nr:hypothetical protein [Chloroflexota bacterium]
MNNSQRTKNFNEGENNLHRLKTSPHECLGCGKTTTDNYVLEFKFMVVGWGLVEGNCKECKDKGVRIEGGWR